MSASLWKEVKPSYEEERKHGQSDNFRLFKLENRPVKIFVFYSKSSLKTKDRYYTTIVEEQSLSHGNEWLSQGISLLTRDEIFKKHKLYFRE